MLGICQFGFEPLRRSSRFRYRYLIEINIVRNWNEFFFINYDFINVRMLNYAMLNCGCTLEFKKSLK